MQTRLSPEFEGTPEGEQAKDMIRKCVHCGFCNATCPTYQILGDELDGPRGRIYLIRQVLEGADVTRSTQQHLDRCLTCLNCQTTCPSGVEYGHLVDIGRKIVDARVRRPLPERTARWLLREGLTSRWFAPALRLGRALRPLLPARLKAKVPQSVPNAAAKAAEPSAQSSVGARRVLMLRGCVQPAMRPSIDAAAARVLGAAGMRIEWAGGCCGALRTHLGDPGGGLDDMRCNVDAWIPHLGDGGAQVIAASATACSLALKGYAHALSGDAHYAESAARVSAMTRDLSELLPDLVPALAGRLRTAVGRLAVHSPCTLQHGQKQKGGIETHLRALGFEVSECEESHFCCGSAGAYSVMQPDLAMQLRDRKLKNLSAPGPEYIISANWGCMGHLQSGTAIPVLHWIELLDRSLGTPG